MSRKYTLSEKGQEVEKASTSSIAESFRTIRTAVFFSIPKDEARIIQITSAEAGEGKSTLASNLSIAMAQSGQRILLLDADLRHPTQHKVFETHRDHGLSSVLAGMKSLDQVLHHTEIKGLDLLVAGPDVPNPADMLSSKAFQDLLNQKLGDYDRIIVDSPPIVPIADGSILAAACDASIIVVRAEKSSTKALQQARKIMASVGAQVMGTLVNDIKRGKHGYYDYGYGYGYGSYYSKHPGEGNRKNGKKAKEAHAVSTDSQI
jgi:capsular exopolysaccharide synthesis family protein